VTPLEAVLEGRRLGVRLWIGAADEVAGVMADGGTPDVRAWLRTFRDADEFAFGFAVAVVAAVERTGGDPTRLLKATTISIGSVQ